MFTKFGDVPFNVESVLDWVFFASPDHVCVVKMLKTPRRREGVFQKGKGPMLDPESTLTGSETRDWYKTPSLCQRLVCPHVEYCTPKSRQSKPVHFPNSKHNQFLGDRFLMLEVVTNTTNNWSTRTHLLFHHFVPTIHSIVFSSMTF